LTLVTVVDLDRLSKPTDMGFKKSRVTGTGRHYTNFGTPFVSADRMHRKVQILYTKALRAVIAC